MALVANPVGQRGSRSIDSSWLPLTFPLRGRYNDYGSIDTIVEEPATEAFFRGLERAAVEREVGDNPVHDIPVRRGMSRKDWLRALWEARVQAEARQRIVRANMQTPPIVEVAQAIIRQDVWQFLVDEARDVLTGRVPVNALRRYLESDTRIDRDSIWDPALEGEVVELNAVCRGLMMLGRPWSQGTCCGPQAPEWRLQLGLFERLTDVARKAVAHIADEDLDDED